MTLTVWIRLVATVAVLAAALALYFAWLAERRDRAQIITELASAKQALEASDARQKERDAKLTDTLATIATEKRAQQSPAEIVKNLLSQMQLPAAITLQPAPETTTAGPATPVGGSAVATATGGFPPPKVSAGADGSDVPGQPVDLAASRIQGVIPGQDLKPLYNYALDCQACQAKLQASQGDLADEQAKTKTLAKERDEAVRVARGGSVLSRIARASKWLLIGAAAGAAAARAAR